MPRIDKTASALTALAATVLLASCQTGSVLSGQNTDDTSEPTQAARTNNKTNPNDRGALNNTKTALTDYCPTLRIRAGTESFRTFPKGEDAETSDRVRYQVSLTTAARECNYVGNELQMRIGARGRMIAGPAGGPGSLSLPIRIAITQGGDTIYSKLYRQTASLPAGKNAELFSFVDEQVVIPAPTSTNVRMFIGFDEGPYNTP